jgi:hypothetical protein
MQQQHSLSRESTTDVLASQFSAAANLNLLPPSYPALPSLPVAAAAAAAAALPVAAAPAAATPIPPTLHPHILSNIERSSTKLQNAAQREAQMAALQQAEPTTPTEEEMEQMEADEIHAAQTLDKAKTRFKAKARQHEELRVRVARMRQRFEGSVARRKQERMRALLAQRMQRQRSEE